MFRSTKMVRSAPLPDRRIASITGDRWTAFMLLGPINAIVLHWDGKRSRACKDRGCDLCDLGLPAFPKGYCAAIKLTLNAEKGTQEWREVILEVPQTLFDALPEGEIRGCAFKAKRATGKSNSRVVMERIAVKLKEIPEAFAVGPYLERVFNTGLETLLPTDELHERHLRVIPIFEDRKKVARG